MTWTAGTSPIVEVEVQRPVPRLVRAHVALGANVPGHVRSPGSTDAGPKWSEPPGTLAAAVHALGALPGVRLADVSSLYRSRPVGPIEQPDFANAVVALDVPAGPTSEVGAAALLGALKALERAFGRRDGPRWGPRPLDLDLLTFGDARVRLGSPGDSGWLEVPHPEAPRRLFVLAPLAELAPALEPPGWPASVAALRDRRRRTEGPGAVVRVGAWQRDPGAWELDEAWQPDKAWKPDEA